MRFRFVEEGGLFYDPSRGNSLKKKPLAASFVGCQVFSFLHLRIQTAFDASFEIKIHAVFTARAFFFLAEVDQISNLKLVEDIYKIMLFIDSKNFV
jgi:hypothetical protein